MAAIVQYPYVMLPSSCVAQLDAWLSCLNMHTLIKIVIINCAIHVQSCPVTFECYWTSSPGGVLRDIWPKSSHVVILHFKVTRYAATELLSDRKMSH